MPGYQDTNYDRVAPTIEEFATNIEEAAAPELSLYSDSVTEDTTNLPLSDASGEITEEPADVMDIRSNGLQRSVEECPVGWYRPDDKRVSENIDGCEDINECTNVPCHKSRAACINKQGDFECECFKSYVGDGFSCYIGLNMLIIPPDKHLHSSIPGIETAYKLTLRLVFKLLRMYLNGRNLTSARSCDLSLGQKYFENYSESNHTGS